MKKRVAPTRRRRRVVRVVTVTCGDPKCAIVVRAQALLLPEKHYLDYVCVMTHRAGLAYEQREDFISHHADGILTATSGLASAKRKETVEAHMTAVLRMAFGYLS